MKTKTKKAKAKGKTKAKVKAKKLTDYYGIVDLPKKLQPAVDDLILLLRKFPGVAAEDTITFHGYYDIGQKAKCPFITIFELSFQHPIGDIGNIGGSSIMRCNPESIGLLTALEEFLETHFLKGKGDEHGDPHADAKDNLEYLWNMPSAESMRQTLCQLQWLEEERPGISLSAAMLTHLDGFYAPTLRKEIIEVMSSLPQARADAMHTSFVQDLAFVPERIFAVGLKGHDKTINLVKWVRAQDLKVLGDWLAHTGLATIVESIIDKADGASIAAVDEILHFGFDNGLDADISAEKGVWTCATPEHRLIEENGVDVSKELAAAWQKEVADFEQGIDPGPGKEE